MPVKIWLDDIREAPRGWTWITNYEDCIQALENENVTYISLDHDLGTEKSGYDVACWIEQQVFLNRFQPPVIQIHSANPVGRKNIQAAIDSIKRGMGWKIPALPAFLDK